MEFCSVVKPLLREVDEILDMVWGDIRKKTDIDLADGRVQLRHLVLVVGHWSILLRFSCRLGAGGGRRCGGLCTAGGGHGGVVVCGGLFVGGDAGERRDRQRHGNESDQNCSPPSY